MTNHRGNHRHSICLQGYNYSRPEVYFITICTHNRECLFGEISDGGMRLNDAGRIVQSVWNNLPEPRNPGGRDY